jgi:hypothetical protein
VGEVEIETVDIKGMSDEEIKDFSECLKGIIEN